MLSSDCWRARAVKLGLSEVHGSMAPARTQACAPVGRRRDQEPRKGTHSVKECVQVDVGMWPDECQRQPSAVHDAKMCIRAEYKRSAWSEDYAEAGTHREFARSGEANDGEGAEVDSVLPRRRHLARDRVVLLGLGLVLRLVLGRLGVRPGVVLVLDLERANPVALNKDAAVLPRERGCWVVWSCCSILVILDRSSGKALGLSLGLG